MVPRCNLCLNFVRAVTVDTTSGCLSITHDERDTIAPSSARHTNREAALIDRDNHRYRHHDDTFRPGADWRNPDHVDGDLLQAIIVLERGALVPHSVVVIAS